MRLIQFTDWFTPVDVIHGLIKNGYFKDKAWDIILFWVKGKIELGFRINTPEFGVIQNIVFLKHGTLSWLPFSETQKHMRWVFKWDRPELITPKILDEFNKTGHVILNEFNPLIINTKYLQRIIFYERI